MNTSKNILTIGIRDLATITQEEVLEALPLGAQRRIARRLGCSPGTVSSVLNGRQTQSSST